MAKKKQLTGKKLSKFLKKNLRKIMTAEHKEAVKLIKSNDYNSHVDIDDATYQVRKLIVDQVGDHILRTKDKDFSKENYISLINDAENSTDILRYHKSGKEKYQYWIGKNIDKLKTINKIKGSKNKELDVDLIEHLMTKVNTESVERKTKKKTQELEEIISQKETEIENVSNILLLDDEDLLVDEIEDEFSTVQKWWEKIGLSSDPFNTNGLQTIKKEDYDEILVNNPAIKRAKDFRTGKNESFVLGTNYMILGKLGTGKTAVIDYIKEFSNEQKIESFVAKMPQVYSVDEMNQQFFHLMYINLKQWYRKNNISLEKMGSAGQADFILGLDEIINEHSSGSLDGFFIFIEDLHKQKDEKIAFEFISSLQALTESALHFKLKCSIILTGSPEWSEVVENDPKLTSVISTTNIIKIPNVTPAIATKAIEKRFEVFRGNKSTLPDDHNDYKYVLAGKKIRMLASVIDRKYHTGYRLYFQEVKKDLEAGNFDIFDVNPLKIDKTLSKEYSSLLKGYPKAKTILDKMYNAKIKDSKMSREKQRILIFNLLTKIFSLNYVHNSHRLIKGNTNKSVLYHLFKYCKAITMDIKTKNWTPVGTLQEFNQALIMELNVGLEYFLTAFHLGEKKKEKGKKESKKIEKEVAEWDTRVIKYQNLLESVDIISEIEVINLIDKLRRKLFVPYYEILRGHERIDVDGIKNLVEQLTFNDLKMLCPNINSVDSVEDAIYFRYETMDEEKRYFESFHNLSEASLDNKRFLKAAVVHIEEIIEGALKRSIIHQKINNYALSPEAKINTPDLNRDFQKIIYEKDEMIGTSQITELQESFQDVFRNYLLFATTLSFGPYRERGKILTKTFPDNAKKRKQRQKLSIISKEIDPNEFEQMQRSEFKVYFAGGRDSVFSKEVTKPLRTKIPLEQLFVIIDQFADINIASSHGKESEFGGKLSNNPNFIYNVLHLIKIMSQTINEKIMDTQVLIEGEGNDYMCFTNSYTDKACHAKFKNIKNKEFTGKGEKGVIGINDSEAFMSICNELGIYCWKVNNIHANLFDIDGSSRLIDLTHRDNIAKSFGNMLYGAGIANLFYSVIKEQITFNQMYGSEFLFSV